MKKVFLVRILLLILLLALAGCYKNAGTTEINLPVGKYLMLKSEEPVEPFVTIEDGNKFKFTYSSLSSYIARGSYEVIDDDLILKTDDGKYKYEFKIKSNKLVFNAKESSEIPSYAKVPDGAVFQLELDKN